VCAKNKNQARNLNQKKINSAEVKKKKRNHFLQQNKIA
jgi:hypothetical protein